MSVFFTKNGGITWNGRSLGAASRNIPDGFPESYFRLDPTLAFDDNGKLYIVYGAMESLSGARSLVCARSTDGGASFTFSTILSSTSNDIDKWIVGAGPGTSGINGQNVYIAYSRLSFNWELYLASSYNEGATFTSVLVDEQSVNQIFGMPAVTNDGSVYVVWDEYSGAISTIKVRRSTNQGQSFSEPSEVVGQTLVSPPGGAGRYSIPAAPSGLLRRGILAVPSIAVDRSPAHTGRIYVAYTVVPVNGSADTDVVVQYRDATALSWTMPRIAHRNNAQSQFHPWISVDRIHGTVAVIYFDARANPDNQRVATYVSVSNDGGENWTEERLSDGESDESAGFDISDTNGYLEYIGVCIDSGIVAAVWPDNSTSPNYEDKDFFYDTILVSEVLSSSVRVVPSQVSTIAGALALSEAGDTVFVSGSAGPYAGFELVGNVHIMPLPGTGRPIVGPVTVPLHYPGTPFSGFTIAVPGSESGISGINTAATVPSCLLVRDCDILGGASGVDVEAINVDCEDIQILGPTGFGIHVVSDVSKPSSARIVNSVVSTPAGYAGNSVGVSLVIPEVEFATEISGCTVNGFKTGIRMEAAVSPPPPASCTGDAPGCGGRGVPPHLAICCAGKWVCPCDGPGGGCPPAGGCPEHPGLLGGPVYYQAVRNHVTHYESVGIDCMNTSGIVQCNNSYSDNPLSVAPYLLCDVSQLSANSSLPPLYCGDNGDPDVADLTLRIDSPATPGNSLCGSLIGALPVECAWDTLERSTVVAPGTTVRVLEDVVIPVGKSLTIQAGCEFRFDGYDNSLSGLDAFKNELLARGPLTVSGTAAAPVRFVSAEPDSAEGDWWGILGGGFAGNPPVSIRNAIVQHSDWGVVIGTSQSASVDSCVFRANALTDIKSSTVSNNLSILANDIYVGGGIGMDLGTAEEVADNSVFGTDTSGVGILLQPTIADSIVVELNKINDISTGPGLDLAGDGRAVLTSNDVSDCRVGVRIRHGRHLIGVEASDVDNKLLSCTTAIHAVRTGPGNCPTSQAMETRVSNVLLDQYTNGVFTEKIADDAVARIELGTDGFGSSGSNLGNNEFGETSDPLGRAIWNNAASCGTVLARGNFFSPNAGSIVGPVDTTGALPTPPLAAPRIEIEQVPPVRPLVLRGVNPNPVVSSTSILFEIGGSVSTISAAIFDLAGRRIRDLGSRTWIPGRQSLEWDGRDDAGRPVQSGLFFVKLGDSGGSSVKSRIVVIRNAGGGR